MAPGLAEKAKYTRSGRPDTRLQHGGSILALMMLCDSMRKTMGEPRSAALLYHHDCDLALEGTRIDLIILILLSLASGEPALSAVHHGMLHVDVASPGILSTRGELTTRNTAREFYMRAMCHFVSLPVPLGREPLLAFCTGVRLLVDLSVLTALY